MTGQTLGLRYEIQAKIIEGPVFDMYAARDRLSGRSVGIREVKSPYTEEADFIRGLVDLIPKLAVGHPAVENLQEVFEEAGQHYILSEMPKGSHLRERIKRFAPFTVPIALSTTQAIAEALDAIHQNGIAHGDVGPHNVIASHDGSAKLQLAGVWQTYPLSRTAGAAVLPQMAPYLAPEVCTGSKPNALSDLYSLGVILFELLTGRLPFVGESPTATTMRHISSPVPSLRGINAAIPVAVEQVVQKLLAKDPKNRYQSAQALITDIRQINDQLRFGRVPTPKKVAEPEPVPQVILAEPKAVPTPKPTKPKPVKKQEPANEDAPEKKKKAKRDRDVPGWLLGLFALAVVACAIGVGWFLYFLSQKPREIRTPNIRGISVAEAREQVRKLNLNVKVISKEPNERLDVDHIILTRPSAGQMIREGGTVDLVVSSGSRKVKIPNLLNMTADEAKIALAALNLSLDGKPSRIVNRDSAPGLIIKQLPRADETVSRFSKVRIWIAAADQPIGSLPGEGEEQTAVARSFKFKYKVQKAFGEVRVKVEMTDEAGTKDIYEEYHSNGDEIEETVIGYGTKATFKVYYDGELKETLELDSTLGSLKPVTPPAQ